MDNQKPISLTELLAQNAEQILDQLIKELRKSGGPNYQQMPRDILRVRVERLFDAFWQGISQNNPKPMIDYIRSTSRERGNEGFTVSELQTVGLRLRDALLNVVDKAYADETEVRLRHSRQIEELILTGIGAGVRGFVNGRESLIQRQYEALRRNQKKKE